MICIRPIAPLGEIARMIAGALDAHDRANPGRGMPKRCAASAMKAREGIDAKGTLGRHALRIRAGAKRCSDQQAGKEEEGCAPDGGKPSGDSAMATGRHRSVPLAALGRTVPVQPPGGLVVGRLEQIGADRLANVGSSSCSET